MNTKKEEEKNGLAVCIAEREKKVRINASPKPEFSCMSKSRHPLFTLLRLFPFAEK